MHGSNDFPGLFILRMVLLIAIGSALVVQVAFALTQNSVLAVILATVIIAALPLSAFARSLIDPRRRAQAVARLHADAHATTYYLTLVLTAIRWLCTRAQMRARIRARAAVAAARGRCADLLVRRFPRLTTQILARAMTSDLTADERQALLLAVAEQIRSDELVDCARRTASAWGGHDETNRT